MLFVLGGWMRKGLGTVVSVEGKLRWTFTAPHFGYWIAAPLSSTRGKCSVSTIFAMFRSKVGMSGLIL